MAVSMKSSNVIQGVNHLITSQRRFLSFCEQFKLSPLPATELVISFLGIFEFNTCVSTNIPIDSSTYILLVVNWTCRWLVILALIICLRSFVTKE